MNQGNKRYSKEPHENSMKKFTGALHAFVSSPAAFIRGGFFLKSFATPFVLNIVIFTSFFIFSYTFIQPEIAAILEGQGWMMRTLRYMVSPVLFVILWLFTAVCYSAAASFILSYFLWQLSIKAEKYFSAESTGNDSGFASVIKSIAQVSFFLVISFFLWVAANLFILPLAAIPIAGIFLYLPAVFFISALFPGVIFMYYPLDRRGVALKDKLLVCLRHTSTVAGIGTGYLLSLFIPLLGYLGVNLAVIASTEIFVKTPLSRIETGKRNNEK